MQSQTNNIVIAFFALYTLTMKTACVVGRSLADKRTHSVDASGGGRTASGRKDRSPISIIRAVELGRVKSYSFASLTGACFVNRALK